MTQTAAVPLQFRVGARSLGTIRRRLVRVPLSLADALDGAAPVLAPLPPDAHGWLVTSLPVEHAAETARGGDVALMRQRYTRHWIDLTIGHPAWWAGLSGNARSQLRRKAKRLAEANGGTLDVRRFATPDEIARFLPVARAVSATTYQDRLLGSGLPVDEGWTARVLAHAAADGVRGWLLVVDGQAIAYLFGEADGDTLRYDHVGHDPAQADRSPGAVLQAEAIRDLMREGRFARFDFTEGEGRHKRQLATGGVECCDLLLLRPTLANRVTAAALAGFDAGVALAKRAAVLRRLARRVGR